MAWDQEYTVGRDVCFISRSIFPLNVPSPRGGPPYWLSPPFGGVFFGLELRYRPPYELIEQRHSERQITVCGAINHSLLDQNIAQWTKDVDLRAQDVCNVAGTIGARAKLRHSTKALFFSRSESVKSHSKETQIKTIPDDGRGLFYGL